MGPGYIGRKIPVRSAQTNLKQCQTKQVGTTSCNHKYLGFQDTGMYGIHRMAYMKKIMYYFLFWIYSP